MVVSPAHHQIRKVNAPNHIIKWSRLQPVLGQELFYLLRLWIELIENIGFRDPGVIANVGAGT